METFLFQSKSKKDIALLKSIADKIGLKTHKLTTEEMEDIGLAKAMKKAGTGKYVNTGTYLKNLKRK